MEPVNVYDDPDTYDLEYPDTDEVPLLLDLAVTTGGPILDLACGTGRTSLPLAVAGYALTGVDRSRPMLDRARAKAAAMEVDAVFVEQDVCRLDVRGPFGLVTMTGNAFQEVLAEDDVRSLLAGVARHLRPGGAFVFDTRDPSPANLERAPGEQPWQTTRLPGGRTIVATVEWSYDLATGLQDYLMIERTMAEGQVVDERRTAGRLRYATPAELAVMLDAAGMDLEAIHGAWDGSPRTSTTLEMVVIARKR